METAVMVKVFSPTFRGSATTCPGLPSMGILDRSSIGSPISTLIRTTLPFEVIISGIIIPARVLIRKLFPLICPFSYIYFATQRITLPHISASVPSELKIFMSISASGVSLTRTNPSAPIPKFLSQTLTARLESSLLLSGRSFSSLASTSTKSFPSPCTLKNFTFAGYPLKN